MICVAWFSAGVSSAVACKLAINRIDRIIYTHIEDQHPDTLRFVRDCEQWFGKRVEITQSRYRTVADAICSSAGGNYIGGSRSPCTRLLKRRVRQEWELEQGATKLCYIWGMDSTEGDRAERIRQAMPKQEHIFPLIDRQITKAEAHRMLAASGVKRPTMYDLGYHNNNCIGCVKGGMGYWNKIRVDFPDVFAARAALERRVGGSCINGVYLDELDPERGRHEGPIADECGIYCEVMKL